MTAPKPDLALLKGQAQEALAAPGAENRLIAAPFRDLLAVIAYAESLEKRVENLEEAAEVARSTVQYVYSGMARHGEIPENTYTLLGIALDDLVEALREGSEHG